MLYHPEQLAEKHYYGNTPYYNFNQNASEYYRGHENKLALYADTQLGHHAEVQCVLWAPDWNGIAQKEKCGCAQCRRQICGPFCKLPLRATAPDGTVIAPVDYEHNWLNMADTAALTYKMTKQFGFTADFTYNTQHPAMNSFAPAEMPNTGRISIPLGRAGIYYNNDWISLTSLFSYIEQNQQQLNTQPD